ncbi:hypothetical protein J7E38_21100 [Bacillus sp. ISL-35]|uniref:hypothetical protein n=1 Tax=Bacillus sp. ISL-35 TaxID=2819122 RepID=UPI001BE5CA61|nr:hypothetical protein [Bacillus sp. ISL-35]MBT2681469.1 hypothetical protein [Bacillus sp. ISL-35]MBT2701936.1 hypothetical protein [Chryseobacterium sp. ISL-80]
MLYTEFINRIVKSPAQRKELEEDMGKLEVHALNLLKDMDVCRFIIKNWFGKFDHFLIGPLFDVDSVIDTVNYYLEDKKVEPDPNFKGKGALAFVKSMELTINKDEGAIKLSDEFRSWDKEVKEFLIYTYVKAFCDFKTSESMLIIEPKETIEQPKTFEEKAIETLGLAVLGNVTGVPGIGLMKKVDNWSEKIRQKKIYNERMSDVDINFFDEILKQEKFQRLKSLMIKRVQENL